MTKSRGQSSGLVELASVGASPSACQCFRGEAGSFVLAWRPAVFRWASGRWRLAEVSRFVADPDFVGQAPWGCFYALEGEVAADVVDVAVEEIAGMAVEAGVYGLGEVDDDRLVLPVE